MARKLPSVLPGALTRGWRSLSGGDDLLVQQGRLAHGRGRRHSRQLQLDDAGVDQMPSAVGQQAAFQRALLQ